VLPEGGDMAAERGDLSRSVADLIAAWEITTTLVSKLLL